MAHSRKYTRFALTPTSVKLTWLSTFPEFLFQNSYPIPHCRFGSINFAISSSHVPDETDKIDTRSQMHPKNRRTSDVVDGANKCPFLIASYVTQADYP
jgi:hypothetical protein